MAEIVILYVCFLSLYLYFLFIFLILPFLLPWIGLCCLSCFPTFGMAITLVTCLCCITKLLSHLNHLGLELGLKPSTLKTEAVCFSVTFVFTGLHSLRSKKSTGRNVELNSSSVPFYGFHPRSFLPVFIKNIWNTKNWMELFNNRICHRGSKIFQKCRIHPQSFRHQFPY